MENQQIIAGYANLNKAYNDTFDALQDVMENGFDDPEVIQRYNYGLNILDEALTIMKEKHVVPAMKASAEKSNSSGFKVMGKNESEAEYSTDSDADENETTEENSEEKPKGFRIFGGKKK